MPSGQPRANGQEHASDAADSSRLSRAALHRLTIHKRRRAAYIEAAGNRAAFRRIMRAYLDEARAAPAYDRMLPRVDRT